MELFNILSSPRPTTRSDLKLLPSTVPLTPLAALAPPLIYYLAAVLLPPFPSYRYGTLIGLLRNTLAVTSAFLFFRLPLRYHVPFSIGLTYQLALVGLYGGCRVLDAFFISLYLFDIIPRRVKYHRAPRDLLQTPCGPDAESYFSMHFLKQGGTAVTETATTDEGWPHGWKDRMSWALELELSMRGAGFTCRCTSEHCACVRSKSSAIGPLEPFHHKVTDVLDNAISEHRYSPAKWLMFIVISSTLLYLIAMHV